MFRRLLDEVGFAWATRIIGFVSLATLAFAVVLIKPVGARSTRQLFDRNALNDLPYITFVIAALLVFAGILVPFFVVADFAHSFVDMDTERSFDMLALLNGMQFLGRVIPALLSDWVGPELLLLGSEASAGILGFCWIAVHNQAGYIGWLAIYGFNSGLIVTLPAVVLPYICPSMATIGTRLGMVYAPAGIGLLISSPVVLALVSTSSGYVGAQCWVGATCICAACFFLLTAIEARKRRHLYEENGGGQRLYLLRKRRGD